MSHTPHRPARKLFDALPRWQWAFILFWTFVSGIGLYFDVRQETSEAEESARIEVRAHFDEHVLIRKWAALHGGVYALIDRYTLPNPFLEDLVEERDITTPHGKALTLINPAYLTRQLLELGQRDHHPSITHLTSLRPVNPANAPDTWERAALQRFESGEKEVSSVGDIAGKPYMRLMRPLLAERPCLTCHAVHGYQEGDIRGGISIAVPMAPHLAVSAEHRHRMLVVHGSLWFFGCLGIWWGMQHFRRRVQHELTLNDTLHKLSSALEQAGEAVLITNAHGVIEYSNHAFEQLLGWSFAQVAGKSPRFLRARSDDPARFRHMWHQIRRGHIWQQEMPLRHRQGKVLTTLVSVAPVVLPEHAAASRYFVGIIRDVSREHDLEINLRQMQKMESLGVLVGGIAHDFNNVLTGMLGHMYLARSALAEDDNSAQALKKAETLGFRASSMISQLLAFARRDQISMQEIDFAPFFKEAVKLARVSIPENIRLNCHVGLLKPVAVFGDATQLQQIIMNLLNNARDALTHIRSPEISIFLDLHQADEAFSTVYHLPDGKYVRVRVQDNGSGIAPEHREKIFDPFFTTKPKGKGTGLGLAMVYGAVRTHGGVIEVESTQDEGTCFTIYLPMHEKTDSATVQRSDDILPGEQECILLADDDQGLRESLQELLERFGYRVITAEDGIRAVECFRQHQEDIALVMMDLVMPGLSGIEAARQIRQHAETPLLLMTGYDHKQMDDHALPVTHAVLLTKPFDLVQLSHQLRLLIQNTSLT